MDALTTGCSSNRKITFHVHPHLHLRKIVRKYAEAWDRSPCWQQHGCRKEFCAGATRSSDSKCQWFMDASRSTCFYVFQSLCCHQFVSSHEKTWELDLMGFAMQLRELAAFSFESLADLVLWISSMDSRGRQNVPSPAPPPQPPTYLHLPSPHCLEKRLFMSCQII